MNALLKKVAAAICIRPIIVVLRTWPRFARSLHGSLIRRLGAFATAALAVEIAVNACVYMHAATPAFYRRNRLQILFGRSRSIALSVGGAAFTFRAYYVITSSRSSGWLVSTDR